MNGTRGGAVLAVRVPFKQERSVPTWSQARARDPQPEIRILRHRYRGDPHLPDLEIEIDWSNVA